jgi:hypothetical protein
MGMKRSQTHFLGFNCLLIVLISSKIKTKEVNDDYILNSFTVYRHFLQSLSYYIHREIQCIFGTSEMKMISMLNYNNEVHSASSEDLLQSSVLYFYYQSDSC